MNASERPGTTATRRWDPGAVHELAIAGALGGLIGLYYYGEVASGWPSLRQSSALWWARDLLAGVVIGGAIGFFLTGLPTARSGSWLKLAREGIPGAVLAALGGALGLLLGELVLGGMQGGPAGRALSWSVLGLGIGVLSGAGLAELGAAEVWRAGRTRGRLPGGPAV